MSQGGSKKKVANSLVAMSSAAVLAVYAAGYTRTRSAANRLEAQAAVRRPATPAAPRLPVPARQPEQVAATPAPAAKPKAGSHPATPAPAQAPEQPAAVEAVPASPPVEQPVAPAEPKVEVAAAVAVTPAAPPEPPPAPPAPPAPKWKDGTWYGWGSSRHGDIQAAVVIEGGHISSASITQCLTRYSCSVIGRLAPEVAERQSPDVDYVSGATQSANAFYYAVVDALNKAK